MNYNDNSTSRAISLLRFPLAIGIVLLHCNGQVGGQILVPRMVWEVFVPFFFTISGYLYFYQIHHFDSKQYVKKSKKRFWGLFVPYIIWNVIAIPFMTLLRCNTLIREGGIKFLWDDLLAVVTDPVKVFWGIYEVTSSDVFGNDIYSLWCMDLPLWFVRDLMLICLLTPLIYWFIKKLGVLGMILLFIPVAMGLRPIATPRLTSIFYFMLGAYFSINSISLNFKKYYIYGGGAIILLIIGVFSDILLVKNVCQNFYIIFAMAFFMRVAYYASIKWNCTTLVKWQKYSFFIFAFHTLLPVYGTKSILWSLMCSDSYPYILNLLGYLVISIIVVLECMALYHIIFLISPKFNALINGKYLSILVSRK